MGCENLDKEEWLYYLSVILILLPVCLKLK